MTSGPPSPAAAASGRRAAARYAIYLLSRSGADRPDAAAEAIRLARAVHRGSPDDPEAAGLLALLLLREARRGAGLGPDGARVPVASQDRALWDAALVAEGLAVLAATAPGAPRGPFELEAAMAAVHGRAPTGAETDWHLLQELSADLLRLGDHPALRARHAWIAARATLAASVEGPPGRGILPG